MSLSESERHIIVSRELEKAQRTFDGSLLSDLVIMRDNADYNCFFEADEEKLSPYIEPTRLLIQKIKQFIANK